MGCDGVERLISYTAVISNYFICVFSDNSMEDKVVSVSVVMLSCTIFVKYLHVSEYILHIATTLVFLLVCVVYYLQKWIKTVRANPLYDKLDGISTPHSRDLRPFP